MRKCKAFDEMLTLKGISEASALRHIAKEAVCQARVDGEQLAPLGTPRQRSPSGSLGVLVGTGATAGGPVRRWWLQPLQLP